MRTHHLHHRLVAIGIGWLLLWLLTGLGATANESVKPLAPTDTLNTQTTPDKTSQNQPTKEPENTNNPENEPQLNRDYSKVQLPDSDSISFIKSVMALFFVLGLIFLAAYVYKKLSGIKTTGFRGNRVNIDMVGHMALGEKKFLAIVAIEDKHYFIGITPMNITLLAPLELSCPPQPDTPTEGGSDFENIFKRARMLLQQRGKK